MEPPAHQLLQCDYLIITAYHSKFLNISVIPCRADIHEESVAQNPSLSPPASGHPINLQCTHSFPIPVNYVSFFPLPPPLCALALSISAISSFPAESGFAFFGATTATSSSPSAPSASPMKASSNNPLNLSFIPAGAGVEATSGNTGSCPSVSPRAFRSACNCL